MRVIVGTMQRGGIRAPPGAQGMAARIIIHAAGLMTPRTAAHPTIGIQDRAAARTPLVLTCISRA